MKIGIVIATYRKLDGSTYKHLKNTLESVKNQTHKDYKVFLIGDDYTDNNELIELSKIIDDDKIYIENLPIALERIKYDGIDLWRNGGLNAVNTGIKKALDDGFEYICNLDHDDYYKDVHLELISKCIEDTNTNFITTKCGSYPNIDIEGYYTKYRPIASRLFKVSTCVNFKYFNMLFRNMIEETGKSYAGDADLWNRINIFLENKNEYGIFINESTCRKIGGKIPILKPNIVK
jgi:hypothetical protein